MDLAVDLREMMALVLIDEKQVAGLYGVKAVVDEKLTPAGNGKIQFIAVVDMHIHRFFVAVQMCQGKGMILDACINGVPAGSKYLQNAISSLRVFSRYHSSPNSTLFSSIKDLFKICKIYDK